MDKITKEEVRGEEQEKQSESENQRRNGSEAVKRRGARGADE
jgi:hypothetical protein